MVLAAAQYLDNETILKHLPFIGNDEIDNILDNVTREEANRYGSSTETNGETTNEDGAGDNEDLPRG